MKKAEYWLGIYMINFIRNCPTCFQNSYFCLFDIFPLSLTTFPYLSGTRCSWIILYILALAWNQPNLSPDNQCQDALSQGHPLTACAKMPPCGHLPHPVWGLTSHNRTMLLLLWPHTNIFLPMPGYSPTQMISLLHQVTSLCRYPPMQIPQHQHQTAPLHRHSHLTQASIPCVRNYTEYFLIHSELKLKTSIFKR